MIINSDASLIGVNRILTSIGDAPIETLSDLTDINAINAVAILDKENRALQIQGWSFNVFTDITLASDTTTNKIRYTDDILYLKGDDNRLIRRGDYVYDLDNQTFIFENGVTVSIVRKVSFEEMPYPAQDYIIAKASASFAIRYLGDPDLSKVLNSEVTEAWMHLNEYELDMGEFSIYDNDDITTVGTRS